VAAALLGAFAISASMAQGDPTTTATVGVGAQYDTTHVYLAAGDLDAFVNSFVATFGGKPSARIVINVLPVPSSTQFRAVSSPVGPLAVFAFQTPVPYPFGQERNGYLVTDMDQALQAARAAGAEVIVDKFTDPIGVDAVIQWPGGVKMQLYWHFTAPSSAPLETIPENRVYLSRDRADTFVGSFVRFSHGSVAADETQADAGEIGRRGEKYRRIDIKSTFGKIRVLVSDGHLPYPFGHEMTGYEVKDLGATLRQATAAGAKVLVPPLDARDRSTAIVEFPGGYIAEIHAPRTR
jgi:predicted enzyme related to lactoylglutathione lyase